MKDPLGHGSDTHSVAMRGLKLASISKHRANHGNKAAFTKLRTIRNGKEKSAAELRAGSGHKSDQVAQHPAMKSNPEAEARYAANTRAQAIADRRY